MDAKDAGKDQSDQNTRSHDAVQAIIDQIKPNLAYTAAIQALPGTAPVAHDVAAKAGADQPVVKQSFVAGHVEMSCEKHHEAEVGSSSAP